MDSASRDYPQRRIGSLSVCIPFGSVTRGGGVSTFQLTRIIHEFEFLDANVAEGNSAAVT